MWRIIDAILLFPARKTRFGGHAYESANPRKYCVQFVQQDGFFLSHFTSSNILIIHPQQHGKFGDPSLIK